MSLTHESPLNIEQIEHNFREIAQPLSEAEAVLESNRCVYCFDAPCMHACPTHIDVPSFIKKIASGNLLGSARVIFDANPIGATCARVCPVDVLCEGACVEKTLMDKPIEIGRLQRYATDYVMRNDKQIFGKGAPNGKSVGVVGSGPAGLSCATYLARLGYAVTIYDKKSLPGGLDTYGMAEYKMSQAVSVGEARQVEKAGVEFQLETEIVPSSRVKVQGSNQISFEDLQNRHDAIFLGVGLGATNKLNIIGEDAAGVFDALDFIERIKTRDWKSVPLGKTVAVIGAGNTAIDAVTQAKRLGAERVLMIYRRTERDISAYQYEYELAKKDGVEFLWQTAPIGILTDETGNVAALRCEKTGASNDLFEVPCDMVIKAIGQQKQFSFFETVAGVATDEKGRVTVNELMQTSNPRIFAGGDCVNGGAEAVDAAQTGKLAAQGIHFSLTGEQIEFAGARIPVFEKSLTRIRFRKNYSDNDMDFDAEKKHLLTRDAEWSNAASEGKDIEFILSFWTDDAIVMPSGFQSGKGKDELRQYVENSLQIPGFRISWQSSDVKFSPDGNMAYMFSQNKVSMNGKDGNPLTTQGRAVTIWRRETDGEWRCVVDIWNAED